MGLSVPLDSHLRGNDGGVGLHGWMGWRGCWWGVVVVLIEWQRDAEWYGDGMDFCCKYYVDVIRWFCCAECLTVKLCLVAHDWSGVDVNVRTCLCK